MVNTLIVVSRRGHDEKAGACEGMHNEISAHAMPPLTS